MNLWLKTTIWFVVLVVLQVMLFNHLQLAYVINTFPYIFVVVAFPNSMDKISKTIVGFILGFVIDMLCGTWGIHIIATTLVAYIQPSMMKLLALPEQLDRKVPSFRTMKWKFLQYVALMVFIHHLLLFSLETFDITLWYWILIKSIVSSIVTICILILFDKISNA